MRRLLTVTTLVVAIAISALAGVVPTTQAAGPGLSGGSLVQYALGYLGAPYANRGHTPMGFSDVGFVAFVLRHEGLNVPRSRGKLLKLGTPVIEPDLEPGDILYFQNTVKPGLSHVGIYIGNDQFIHSEWYQVGVTVSALTNDPHDDNYWAQHFLAANRIG